MSEDQAINPMRAAQANMRSPVIRRFYKEASVAEVVGGFAVRLDGRGARTPGKRPVVAPTRALAELIAAEWAAQGEIIDPAAMPATRLANAAIDGVADTLEETRADVLSYAASDLLCYRAQEPEELCALHARTFDPVLGWMREAHGASFTLVAGVIHVAQPKTALAAFEAAARRHADSFSVAALHSLTALSGSAILALAVAEGAIGAGEAWRAAHVDEDYQIAKWGEDDEAAARRAARWREFEAAAKMLAAIG